MSTYEPGDYVKVELPDDVTGVGEWMWVRVEVCDDKRKQVYGRLENEPLNDFDEKLELGSHLVVSYAQNTRSPQTDLIHEAVTARSLVHKPSPLFLEWDVSPLET